MTEGIPLNDHDRWPWLAALSAAIVDALTEAHDLVLATCSALKQIYRQDLASIVAKSFPSVRVVFVWLDVPKADLEARLGARKGHYMSAGLLASQLANLEPPNLDCSRIAITMPPSFA